MNPRGEDVASAIRDWIKEELKNSPRSCHDLGKFFFGVSSASIGIILTLEKLSIKPSIDWKLILSLGFIFISMILSLYMVIPIIVRITSDIDLYKLHETQVSKIIYLSILWFISWIFGISSSIWATFF